MKGSSTDLVTDVIPGRFPYDAMWRDGRYSEGPYAAPELVTVIGIGTTHNTAGAIPCLVAIRRDGSHIADQLECFRVE